uniref:Dolichyl-diphosphooligosaccharide--protein glycosyltransferase subunit 2 n=1 Tax=Nicotiana sylvestris TaxID=4096 RepID=A0A1U7YG46_NICSY|nr:PREDICTED: dolichyl-diphosphooligosaccharide--protein glycosyltransferase subunit 2-like [Nicotiana sylvestris]
MGKVLGFFILAMCTLICETTIFKPISDSHRSAALDLLTPKDGSFESLEVTYKALRSFEVLGTGKQPDIKAVICKSVVDTLRSPSSASKDLFQALRVNRILKCELNNEAFAGIASRLKDNVNSGGSVGSLVLIEGQAFKVDVHLGGADSVFRAIKALSQSDGRWRYSSNDPESSTFAAGIALESLAGVVSLASSEIDNSLSVFEFPVPIRGFGSQFRHFSPTIVALLFRLICNFQLCSSIKDSSSLELNF